ncbi:MAG: hypothetical protein AB1482_03825 [Pseudomonadota bacterium]
MHQAGINFAASLSQDDVHEMESFSSSPDTGMRRRIALLVASQDADKLREIRGQSPEVFADLVAAVAAFHTHAAALLDLATVAEARLAQIEAEAGATPMH